MAGDNPEYNFASFLDFAEDKPYQEMRGLNAGTGTARSSRLFFPMNELSLFVQNTWQIRPNLTLNYGLRWDSYFNNTHVMLARGATGGFVLTSGVFTDEARAFAKGNHVELMEGKALHSLIRGVSLPSRIFRDPLSVVTTGAPFCPECQTGW